MLEEKLLTYQLRGKNWNSNSAGKKRKGPVVALVDTSASMRGAPEILAKAVVLAITRRMLRENRGVSGLSQIYFRGRDRFQHSTPLRAQSSKRRKDLSGSRPPFPDRWSLRAFGKTPYQGME